MKDLPRHIKKLNRQVIRSSIRESEEAMAEDVGLPPFQNSKKEARKKVKRKMKKEVQSRTQPHDTQEERNRKMKHRVPAFDKYESVPHFAKPTKKKTPRI